MLTTTVHAIGQLKTVDGINMKGLETFLKQITDAGIEIKKPSHLGNEYFIKNSIKLPYLDKLVNNIEARFDDKSVMASFDIFNPAKLPNLPDKPSTENYLHLKQEEVVSKLCCDSSLAAIYPNMSTLAKVCCVVPIQTADVERTFSQIKLIRMRRL